MPQQTTVLVFLYGVLQVQELTSQTSIISVFPPPVLLVVLLLLMKDKL
jgi:hypothetical protein